jgi:hypothetical protein
MIKSEKTVQEQEAIIAEYLLGDTTYRKLGANHGVDWSQNGSSSYAL